MDRCVRALGLPDWFGRNWDALADSLSDRAVWPEDADGRGLLLVVRGWRAYADARPQEWTTAQEVFAEAAERAPRSPWRSPLEDPPSIVPAGLDDPTGPDIPVAVGE